MLQEKIALLHIYHCFIADYIKEFSLEDKKTRKRGFYLQKCIHSIFYPFRSGEFFYCSNVTLC